MRTSNFDGCCDVNRPGAVGPTLAGAVAQACDVAPLPRAAEPGLNRRQAGAVGRPPAPADFLASNRFPGVSRRRWLRQGAGALLALGLGHGCARLPATARGGEFHFVVLNDTHYQSPQCGRWFDRVGASIRSHTPPPAFCLVAGDLSEHGTAAELGAMREALDRFGLPVFTVIGNHDYAGPSDRRAYEQLFPERLNYHFEHAGWQFVGLDSTDGNKAQGTRIQPATLAWLDATLPRLDPERPVVVLTHFPLGIFVPMRPANAAAVLERLLTLNLVAVFSGHFHGFTERRAGRAALTTNKCCAISRANHDGTRAKGYFLCAAGRDGLRRQFVEVTPG